MNSSTTQKPPRDRRAIEAEAGAWLARLHGPNRTAEVETGFRAWLSDHPQHAAIFELMTDTWEKAGSLRRRPQEQVTGWVHGGLRLSFPRAAMAMAAVAVLAVIGTLFYLHSDAVSTAVGEQRILTLEDGTRVYLNTATRAVVHYDKTLRRVELDRGEALFEVAKRPDWPFVVVAGDRQIKALGTSFIVRREEQNLAVTLVEGKVAVAPLGAADTPAPTTAAKSAEVMTLLPGQRLTLAKLQPPRLDHPALDKMTAWQRGQVVLDDVPLADAVAEMNRYSAVRLKVATPQAASIRVSGIFRSGDSANFAKAVARTYSLEVVQQSREILLTSPRAPAESSRPN